MNQLEKSTVSQAKMCSLATKRFKRIAASDEAKQGNPRQVDRRFQGDLAMAFGMFIWRASSTEQWILLKTLLNWTDLAEQSSSRPSGAPLLPFAAEKANESWHWLSDRQREVLEQPGGAEAETIAILESKREDINRFCNGLVQATALPTDSGIFRQALPTTTYRRVKANADH